MERRKKISIIDRLADFFARTGVAQRRLAMEAGIAQPIISRLMSGTQKDVMASKAEALERAMDRIEAQIACGTFEKRKPRL